MARLGTETHLGLRQKGLRLEFEVKEWWDGVGGRRRSARPGLPPTGHVSGEPEQSLFSHVLLIQCLTCRHCSGHSGEWQRRKQTRLLCFWKGGMASFLLHTSLSSL